MSKDKPTPITSGYVGLLPLLVMAARKQGYALGLHGSLNRDMDLIAVPWTEEATSAQELVTALAEAIVIDKPHRIRGPYLDKPHNRLCWNLHMDYGAYIDLSVILRAGDSKPLPRVLDEDLNVKQRHALAWQFYGATVCMPVEEPNHPDVLEQLERLKVPKLASELSDAERIFLQSPDRIHTVQDED